MATTITIKRPEYERLKEIEAWCRENIGIGSFRTIQNTWLGMDDWFYIEEPMPDEEEYYNLDDELEDEQNLVFTFRRPAEATLFALKWTTQTA